MPRGKGGGFSREPRSTLVSIALLAAGVAIAAIPAFRLVSGDDSGGSTTASPTLETASSKTMAAPAASGTIAMPAPSPSATSLPTPKPLPTQTANTTQRVLAMNGGGCTPFLNETRRAGPGQTVLWRADVVCKVRNERQRDCRVSNTKSFRPGVTDAQGIKFVNKLLLGSTFYSSDEELSERVARTGEIRYRCTAMNDSVYD